MLYLEELLDAVMAEEGQTLMGLDFLIDTLGLSMKRIDLLFKKALSEYSERRPMKKTTVINNFDYADPESGYIVMPEGTTSCRIARYGVLPNQMPRYYMPKFSEQSVEFDITTLQCRVWPPVTPLRLTYTQRFVPTTNILIEKTIEVPYETDEFEFVLPTMYANKTLTIQKNVVVRDPETGELVPEILSMKPTGSTIQDEDGEGSKAVLKGSLGKGSMDLKSREVKIKMKNDSASPIIVTYYPKWSVVKELDIGNYLFTRIFACKILEALASLRAQASQEVLHHVNLTTDELLTRVAELKKEIRELGRASISFHAMSPM
jgi:hypothetical protein